MSDAHDRPQEEPPVVQPVRVDRPAPGVRAPALPPPRRRGGLGRLLLWLVLVGSLVLNVVLFLALLFNAIETGSGSEPGPPVTERLHRGPSSASDKVAVVRLSGPIMEGALGYVFKQVERAAKDDDVKAVVLQIDSPGGSVTASDDLHRRFTELKAGRHPRHPGAGKPLVAAFGSVAASGGYYVAMPAEHIVAERSTITGSIGVYAQLVNVAKLAEQHGVQAELIRRGEVKGSGSLFKELTPEERQPWQQMVDHAYAQFIGVIEQGRPHLKGKLTEPIPPSPGGFARKRADGGIFTADDALKYGLIDEVGYLDRATAVAAQKAGLSDYKVVVYDRPPSLLSLLSIKEPSQSDLARLARGMGPRLWYLAPQSELAGLLAAGTDP